MIGTKRTYIFAFSGFQIRQIYFGDRGLIPDRALPGSHSWI